MLSGLVFAAACWMMFHKEYAFHHEQLPGNCSDARFHNQSLTEARFFIDDTLKAHHGMVTMRCVIPVHIYPCADDNSAYCARYSSETPLPTARTRFEITNVRCRLFGGTRTQHCKAQNWHCLGAQPCDAYEKAQRLCTHKLKVSPYECYYVPGTTQAGPDQVRFARRAFPIWWLLGSIVLSLQSVVFCCGGAKVIAGDCENRGPKETVVQTAKAVLCFGCIVSVLVVIFLLLSRVSDSPLGRVAVEVANLTRIDEGGRTILPQEEPVPMTPWWQYLLILLAVFGGVALLFGFIMPSVLQHQFGDETKEEEE